MSSPLSPLQIYRQRLKDQALKADPVQARAVDALQNLYTEVLAQGAKPAKKWFRKGMSAPKGVYLYGGVGRGKSMLMDLFYESLPPDITKTRVHFHAFMISVHDYIHDRRDDGVHEAVDATLPMLAARIAEKSLVLCFDEFHVTDVADAMILGRLFTALFERGVVVIATSNWPPDRLYEGGLQRDRFLPFIALLKDRLETFHLDSPTDYRTQFLTQEGSYFCPLDAKAREHADKVFVHLTDGAATQKEAIKVKGRTIKIEQSAKGVARFSFAQLCEQPHGAEDYLKITRKFHTVFLENVPKLGYDRRNEAKRLMILIDALYEAGTRLVMTADAPPDKLYRGHDHGFEFERTVSRLLEMQSTEYLANGFNKL